MRSFEKYIRIRTMLIALPIFTIFLLYLLFTILLPDFLIREKKLIVDKGIVKRIYRNEYKKFAKGQGYIYYPCIDIEVFDKAYSIRLTNPVTENYWTNILETSNNLKKIEFKYQKQRLNGNLVFNPNKIIIDNKIFIPFERNDTPLGWTIMVAFTLFILLCIYLSIWAFKTYRRNHYESDKKLVGKRIEISW